jgi:hypothetical protein
MFRIKLAPKGGYERGREFSLAGSSGWRDFLGLAPTPAQERKKRDFQVR